MKQRFLLNASLTLLLSILLLPGCSQQQAVRQGPASPLAKVENVHAGEFDTGKMWTFDYPPMDYFKRAYNFNPDKAWFEKARLSALRLPGCSASFVSGDGLVMTNHHCARGALDAANKEGENLPENGFYAPTLSDERKIPNLYVDQLVLMEDVTAEVQQAFESGKTDEERVTNRSLKTGEIEKRYRDKTGLLCSVVTFYNGGKYSLYGYKRYTDVRLVFAPELVVAFFGGDYDNFTYPRYDLDVSFFRVYGADGKPLKTAHHFKWSASGAQEGEAVFVLGNPGSTTRLRTVSQLEFSRDQSYPFTLTQLTNVMSILSAYLEKNPDKKMQYQTQLFGISNSQKVFVGRVEGLNDPLIMAKKHDFESKFRQSVTGNPSLASKYGNVWGEIEAIQNEKAALFNQFNAYTFQGLGRSTVLSLAYNIVDLATIEKMPEAQRPERLRGKGLDSAKTRLASVPVNTELDQMYLANQLKIIQTGLGDRHAEFRELMNGRTPEAAAAGLFKVTVLTSKEKIKELLGKSPDEVLISTDPLVSFVAKTSAQASQARTRYTDLLSREQARVQILGKALYDVYSTSIPPDATFTLRLADGVVKGYEYNGTVAPIFTTFYGLYDRYYSFQMKYPWSLPDRWKNPPSSFDLGTRFNFVSTNDIIGGNSGSPLVNKNLEVVGIAFDGNIESLPGDYIYTDEKNRCVSVHSSGILEALEDVYKAERIAKELRGGKMQ